jgi:uncharacterized membrane protein
MNFGSIKTEAKAKMSGKVGFILMAFILTALISMAFSAFGLVILGPLAVGSAALFLNLWRGNNAKYDDLLEGKKQFGAAFLTYLLMAAEILLWSCLFYIPGLIKSYAYSQVFYIRQDHPEMSAKEALRASEKMMDGHKMEFFLLQLSFIGWHILAGFTFGLLYLWLIPYMQMTYVGYYERLKALNEPAEAPAEEPVEA